MTYFYPPSRPRRVKGGIKAQSGGSKSGRSWWARRWLDVLDDFDIGQRISRGRSYARHGQVTDLSVSAGEAKASVQGSMSGAYRVRIGMGVIDKRVWKKLAAKLFARPSAAASLLAGSMPEEAEKAFRSAGASLFPSSKELDTECTCPDWSNPCKHTVAVFFLLAEEFERDPFLVFKLRGAGRDELVKMAKIGPARGKSGLPDPARGSRPEPLPADPGKFWGRGSGAYDPGEAFIPEIPAALPKQLGSFPFWRGEEDFAGAMEGLYSEASRSGMSAFLGEDGKRDPGAGARRRKPRA